MKWVEFTSKFDGKTDATKSMLNTLNDDLSQKSVLVGPGYNPSVADIIVLPVIHPFLVRNVHFLNHCTILSSCLILPSVFTICVHLSLVNQSNM